MQKKRDAQSSTTVEIKNASPWFTVPHNDSSSISRKLKLSRGVIAQTEGSG